MAEQDDDALGCVWIFLIMAFAAVLIYVVNLQFAYTEDLQRRVGQLEVQVKQLEQKK